MLASLFAQTAAGGGGNFLSSSIGRLFLWLLGNIGWVAGLSMLLLGVFKAIRMGIGAFFKMAFAAILIAIVGNTAGGWMQSAVDKGGNTFVTVVEDGVNQLPSGS